MKILLLLILYFLGELKLMIYINLNFILSYIGYSIHSKDSFYESWCSFLSNLIKNKYLKSINEYTDSLVNKIEFNSYDSILYLVPKSYINLVTKWFPFCYFIIFWFYLFFYLYYIIILIKWVIELDILSVVFNIKK